MLCTHRLMNAFFHPPQGRPQPPTPSPHSKYTIQQQKSTTTSNVTGYPRQPRADGHVRFKNSDGTRPVSNRTTHTQRSTRGRASQPRPLADWLVHEKQCAASRQRCSSAARRAPSAPFDCSLMGCYCCPAMSSVCACTGLFWRCGLAPLRSRSLPQHLRQAETAHHLSYCARSPREHRLLAGVHAGAVCDLKLCPFLGPGPSCVQPASLRRRAVRVQPL